MKTDKTNKKLKTQKESTFYGITISGSVLEKVKAKLLDRNITEITKTISAQKHWLQEIDRIKNKIAELDNSMSLQLVDELDDSIKQQVIDKLADQNIEAFANLIEELKNAVRQEELIRTQLKTLKLEI